MLRVHATCTQTHVFGILVGNQLEKYSKQAHRSPEMKHKHGGD